MRVVTNDGLNGMPSLRRAFHSPIGGRAESEGVMSYDQRYSSTPFTVNPANCFDLPFAGIPSFMKARICPSLQELEKGEADVAILGFPYDLGTSTKSGARMAPRAVREASTVYSDGLRGLYDPVLDEMFLDQGQVVVDCGDVDVSPCGSEQSFRNLEGAVRAILDSGAMPIVIGGDHATSIPIFRAMDRYHGLCIVQVDAHLDWTNSYGEFKESHSSAMRRASEMPWVSHMIQFGIRGLGSSGPEAFAEAREWGSIIVPAPRVHERGIDEATSLIPKAPYYYITVDIDGLDPSICPGTGSPQPGGLLYDEVREIIRATCARGRLVGFDVCEVSPSYDWANQTSLYAAQLILDAICFGTK